MAALLACVPVAGLVPRASAQISPGKLSRAHEGLEGITKCTKCHALGSGPSAKKCLACHKEIEALVRAKHGYHYRVVSVREQVCFECHGEHAGREFDLVHWPGGRDAFPHVRTGFSLEGGHAKLECRKCHTPSSFREDPRLLNAEVDVERTYLGLGPECLGCHEDEHRGQIAPDCINCHVFDAWKPAPRFVHDRARYPLTGKHVVVECGKCHPTLTVQAQKGGEKEGRKFVRYAGLEFRECRFCHETRHRKDLGEDCGWCHRTSGWAQVATKRFNHDRTRFVLLGLHAKVECSKCHPGSSKLETIPFARCRDCHQDVHRGQFGHRKDKGACESCHSEDGFMPADFTLRDHAKTRFPLAGSHMAEPCIACHELAEGRGEEPYRRFRFESVRCGSCHEDVHAGQFIRRKPVKDCKVCHSSTRWGDLAFDHDRDSRFPLEGAHRKVPCGDCHKAEQRGGSSLVRYRPIDSACKTCHGGKNLVLEKG